MKLGWSLETRLIQKIRLHFYILEEKSYPLKLDYQLIYSNGKNNKYLTINLKKKDMEVFYMMNYRTLLRDIKDLNEWRDIPCVLIGIKQTSPSHTMVK